jgi:hypothetical protein
MAASPEMRAWLEQLQQQDHKLGLQNRALVVALALGVTITLVVLWTLYRSTVGAYAALDRLQAVQHPVCPGRIDFSFHVTRPGQIFYRRSSGGRVTEMIDTFHTVGNLERPWSWSYTPGEAIVVTAWYRSWLLRRSRQWQFPTTRRLDIVMLLDTTESMGSSLQHIKKQCADFSEGVVLQGWQPHYAVVAFGSRENEPWLYRHGPTDDMVEFMVAIDQVPRFPDGPSPGAALDALEEALSMPFEKGSTRRVFLITDQGFHPATRQGTTAAKISERLVQKRVRLDVFSRPQFRSDYEVLLSTVGRFYPLERFGQLMTPGQVLED